MVLHLGRNAPTQQASGQHGESGMKTGGTFFFMDPLTVQTCG